MGDQGLTDSAVWFDQGFHTEVVLFGFNVRITPFLFFPTDIVQTSELPSEISHLQRLSKHALQTCKVYLCSLTLEHTSPVFVFSFPNGVSNGEIIRGSPQPQWC